MASIDLKSSHRSLRVRLPLLMLMLVSVVLAIFMAVAYRLLEMTLVDAGKARAQTAATQIADLMRQSSQQRIGEAQRLARDAAVRQYIRNPTGAAEIAAARQRLTSWAGAAGQPAIELWVAPGVRAMTLPGRGEAADQSDAAPPAGAPPSTMGIGAFRESHGLISFDIVATIVDAPAEAGRTPTAPVGHVVIRRSFSSVPTSDALRQLLGSGAVIKLGNQSGGVWTDLSKVVAAPPLSAAAGAAAYTLPDGAKRLGAMVPIVGTPWAVVVEFRREVVVAPARLFLWRILLIAGACIVLATVGARLLSGRITTPLHDLTAAAEAISAGDYAQAVAVGRRDEIGRLGVAFNAMTEQVRDGRRDLEGRVEARVTELKAAREELDRFFSLSLDLLCIAEGGHLKLVNPAWHEVLGWSAAELTAVPYVEFVHPDDVASTIREGAKLAEGLTTVSFENRYRCKDGTYRWLQWKAAPAWPEGVIYAAARDVTEQKRAAAARESHIGELAALNQELEAFSYVSLPGGHTQ